MPKIGFVLHNLLFLIDPSSPKGFAAASPPNGVASKQYELVKGRFEKRLSPLEGRTCTFDAKICAFFRGDKFVNTYMERDRKNFEKMDFRSPTICAFD
jgi:hypothetical protein